MARTFSDGHIQILGAAANGWLSGGIYGSPRVYAISTYVEEKGRQVARGLRSNPRPAMVEKMVKDGLLQYIGASDDLRLTETGRACYEADERTVKIEAGRKLKVIPKSPQSSPDAVDLSQFDRPAPMLG